MALAPCFLKKGFYLSIDSCPRRNDKVGESIFFPFSLGGKGLGIGGVFENENNPEVISLLVFETPHRETESTSTATARINTARIEEQEIPVSAIR